MMYEFNFIVIVIMGKEEIQNLIKEEVDKRQSELGLIKKEKPVGHVNYYNPMYMKDSWYDD